MPCWGDMATGQAARAGLSGLRLQRCLGGRGVGCACWYWCCLERLHGCALYTACRSEQPYATCPPVAPLPPHVLMLVLYGIASWLCASSCIQWHLARAAASMESTGPRCLPHGLHAEAPSGAAEGSVPQTHHPPYVRRTEEQGAVALARGAGRRAWNWRWGCVCVCVNAGPGYFACVGRAACRHCGLHTQQCLAMELETCVDMCGSRAASHGGCTCSHFLQVRG